jgi:hypothetical protein
MGSDRARPQLTRRSKAVCRAASWTPLVNCSAWASTILMVELEVEINVVKGATMRGGVLFGVDIVDNVMSDIIGNFNIPRNIMGIWHRSTGGARTCSQIVWIQTISEKG